MTNVHWGYDPLGDDASPPEPILLYACTAEERAVLDAAQAYVATMEAVRAVSGGSSRDYVAARQAAEQAIDALAAAVKAAEGAGHVG